MAIKGYQIGGPGWLNAVNETKDAGHDIASVPEFDPYGNLVRIGYCHWSRETQTRIGSVKWFKDNEITVKPTKGDEQIPGTGVANIQFKHKKENERHFTVQLPLAQHTFKITGVARILPDTKKTFVILFDHRIEKNGKKIWKPIVRYDCAHGFIHKDVLWKKGKPFKIPLPTQDKKRAIKIATRELFKDLRDWDKKEGNAFKKGEVGGFNISKELRTAERKLIKTLEENDFFNSESSSLTIFSREAESMIFRINHPCVWMQDFLFQEPLRKLVEQNSSPLNTTLTKSDLIAILKKKGLNFDISYLLDDSVITDWKVFNEGNGPENVNPEDDPRLEITYSSKSGKIAW